MARIVAIGNQRAGREKPRSQLTWLSHGPRPAVSQCGVPRQLPPEYSSSKIQHVTTRRRATASQTGSLFLWRRASTPSNIHAGAQTHSG
jgi:hypothetical protein